MAAPVSGRGSGVGALTTTASFEQTPTWVKVIDQQRCIGCHACTVACKAENDVPLGVNRTFVKEVEVGAYPQTTRAFQVTRCNQCEDAPCTTVCPTRAMYRRPDGIVDFDRSICIGCKACLNACPYDAIYIDPVSNSAEKCNFCAHRIDRGLEPACVSVCPTEAIIVGDRNRPTGALQQHLLEPGLRVRKPERGTRPKLSYSGGDGHGLDPLVAEAVRPRSALERPSGATVTQAAALIGDGGARVAPWDWRVSGYTWTKAVAAGPFLLWPFLALGMPLERQEWTIPLALIGAVGLLLTAVLLVADLTHPERFYLILLRPHWRSWLVRGGVLLLAAAGGVGLFLIGGLVNSEAFVTATGWLLLPLALGLAGYTAFLFRDSKGCQLWQSPLLPLHFVVQATVTGAAVLALVESAALLPWSDLRALVALLLIATALHLALVLSEFVLPNHNTVPNAETHAALRAMRQGRLGAWLGLGLGGAIAAIALAAVSLAASEPVVAYVAAGIAVAAIGAYEHAHVQAGQVVPLA